MASNHTEHYGLSQWERTDKVVMEDFNADNAKIDAAIKAVERRADAKADTSALEALSQTVAGRGNCQIVTGQYIGYGQYGQSSPNSLTFEKPPVLVLISEYNTLVMAQGSSHGFVLQNGTSEMVDVSWSGNSVSWYDNNVYDQMNAAGKVYHYVAFLAL